MTLSEFRTALRRHVASLSVLVLVSAFCILLLADRILVNVPAGHVGVLWRRLHHGTVVDPIYGEGLELILPWNAMAVYPVRYQQIERDVTAIDRDGLRVDLKMSTRFRLKRDRVGWLHKRIGPNYVEVVILPDVAAQTLRVVGRYSAEQVYATE